MAFPAAAEIAGELMVLDSAGSTNAVLAGLARERRDEGRPLPSFAAVVTLDQTEGRGRLGRSWSAPAGTALAVSVLVDPVDAVGRSVPLDRLGWLPLAAGVAMTEAVAELLPGIAGGPSVSLKWPNDVLVAERKVCGILAEVLPDGLGIVIGAGLNLTMRAEQLPVPTATSLALEGAEEDGLAERALAGYLGRLRSHTTALLTTAGSARASGLQARAEQLCGTIGRRVAVERPDGSRIVGVATALDTEARLVVEHDGVSEVFAAADVVHLRAAS